MGWEDAPSHICRGGDIRGLAFCCPPIKPCPIHDALKKAKLTPEEYVKIKKEFAKNTRLGAGKETCFGSLVWCCKPSKPCPIRDHVLRKINMDVDEYMELKKKLAEKLTNKAKYSEEDTIKALAEAFNVSIEEAKSTLEDCDYDIRTAMKLLRLKNLNK